MEIKPLLFIQSFSGVSEKALETLQNLNLPLVIGGKSNISSRDLELMPHIISTEKNHNFKAIVEWAVPKGFTHIICLNEDDENLLNEVVNAKETLLKNPWSLILYISKERDQKKNNAIKKRLLDLADQDYRNLKTQNFICPLFYIQNLNFHSADDLAYQQLLVHHLWKQRDYLKIIVDYKNVHSVKPSSRLFDFHYNFLLVSITSLHNNQRPIHSALSLAMGILIACSPFYGLQTTLIIIAVLIFRLSFPVAFLGSQISLPPIYSLLVPLQVYIGFLITGEEFSFDGSWAEMTKTHFTAWSIGSVIVGVVLALLGGLTWYYLMKNQNTKQKVTWTGAMRGGYWGNLFMKKLISIGGLPIAYFLLYFIVPYFYLFAPKAYKGLTEYYKILYPKGSWINRQYLILKHYFRFAQTIVDQAYQAMKDDIAFEIDHKTGDQLFQTTVSEQGQILLFTHYGGWTLATQGFARRKIPKPIHRIKYKTENLSVEKIIKEKTEGNLKTIEVKPGEPIFMNLHRIMSENGNIAVMGDRPFDDNFELLPFLGKIAPIPTTAFRMAKTYKSRMNFILCFKESSYKYGLVTKVLDMNEMSVAKAMKSYIEFLEEVIQQYPEQWFNHYSYWSSLPTRPDGSVYIPRKYQIITDDSESFLAQ